jgi:hypothetical protein
MRIQNKTEQGNPKTIPKNLKINRTKNPIGVLPVLHDLQET